MGDTALPGTPSLLRVLNDRAALALLIEHGSLTKNQLARLSGLSKPTAAEMIRRLEEAELIVVDGEQTGRRGPAAASYAVVTDRVLGVAVDVTPTAVRSVVVDVTGANFPVATENVGAEDGERPAVETLARAIDRACAAAGKDPQDVTAISVGIQAAVEPRTDDLIFTDELPGWPRHRVREQLADGLGMSIIVENDANLAAIAERASGAGAEASTFALLWMAEGLGLAIDLAGSIHKGASGGAGEIGYMGVPADAAHLDPEAPLIGELVSYRALRSLVRRHGIDVETFEEALDVLGNSPARLQILDDLAPRIAVAVLPVLAVLDPELVIIAGPTGTAGGDELATRVQSWVADNTRWSTRVVSPRVITTPVLHGARQVLLEQVRQSLFDVVSRISP